jgi:hypothetical protein
MSPSFDADASPQSAADRVPAQGPGAGADGTPPRSAWHALATELFENEGLGTVFAHARNVLTGTAVVAAGLYAIQHSRAGQWPAMWTVHFAGHVVAILGALLLVLNLADGLRRLSRRRHHVLLRVLAILVYVALSVRLTQVVIYFRAAS